MQMGKYHKAILVSILMCSFALTACQSAPEDDIVVNKNDGVLENAIHESADGSDGETKTPEMYTDTFDTASATIKGEINANVSYPAEDMPVLRVKPRDITVDEAKHWAEVLFEGNTAYEPKNVKTKSEIEEQILSYREAMSDKEKFYAEHGDVWEYYEQMITDLEKAYETAPETYERKETDWTFHDYSYYDAEASIFSHDTSGEIYDLSKTKVLEMETDATTLNGHQGYIGVSNRDEDDFRLHNIVFYLKDFDNIDALPDSNMTEDEAMAMADEVRLKLNLPDWEIDSSGGDNDRYTFIYTPVYNNVAAVLPGRNAGVNADNKDDAYAANYYYESLEIEIYKGLLTGVSWQSPVEVVDSENDNVAVMELEEVVSAFKSYMQSKYTDSVLKKQGIEDPNAKIVVTDINCRLMRVKIKDNSNEFYMLPAWEFKGEVQVGESYKMDLGVLALINGLDGSVIDVALGY